MTWTYELRPAKSDEWTKVDYDDPWLVNADDFIAPEFHWTDGSLGDPDNRAARWSDWGKRHPYDPRHVNDEGSFLLRVTDPNGKVVYEEIGIDSDGRFVLKDLP